MLDFLAALDFPAGLVVGTAVAWVIAQFVLAMRGKPTRDGQHRMWVEWDKPKHVGQEIVLPFSGRVALVASAGVICFGLSHMSLAPVRTKTDTNTVTVNRNETPPDGQITRAECVRLKGLTFQEVIYQHGLPVGFDRTDAYFDSLAYRLRGAKSETMECTVYFEDETNGVNDRVDRVRIDV